MQGYIITNLITDDRYIGKTTRSIQRRWQDHLAKSRSGSLTHLHKAIRKYGAGAFIIDPLNPCDFDITTEAELNDWEMLMIRLIRKNRKLYNLTDGGEGTTGWVPTEETRKKMRGYGFERWSKAGKIGGKITAAKSVESGQILRIATPESRNKGVEASKRWRELNPDLASANGKKAWASAKIWHGQHPDAASKHGKKIHALGLGMFNLTAEQKAKNGKRGGRKNVETGHLRSISSKAGKIQGPITCCLRWNIRRGKPCSCGRHR